jgi:hypothetical protein
MSGDSLERRPEGRMRSVARDFEREQHTYRPGLRLRGMHFRSDTEIELDFEGIGTVDRTFVVRREAAAVPVISFDEEFARLYRGVPCLTAGRSLNPLVGQMFAARGDELPADEEWLRVRDECIEAVELRSRQP